jgi:aminopeptidase N
MRTLLTVHAVLFVSIVFAQDMTSGGKLRPEQAIMDIRHYTVSLNVDPAQKSIDGFAEIDLITRESTGVLVFDFTNVLTVRKVWVNKKEQPYEHKNNLITLSTSSPLAAGKINVKIQYDGKPHIAEKPPWSGGFTWTTDSNGNPWIDITCQTDGAKIYFPCKDHPSDEPNEGADVIVTVPKGLYVTGPGLLIDQKTKGDKTTFHWQTKYTINNYSILFNIGKFKPVMRTYTTVNGNKVPMYFYVLEEHAGEAERFLDIFERSCRVQEKYFGEYPWVKEKMAITEASHPGMEHQTSNTYGANFKYRTVGGKDFDDQIHHEFGHEWWGNKVTGIDWADMWVQEGIDTYGDALYIREYEGEEGYQKLMQRTARNIENKQPVVPGKDVDTDSVYQRDIYGKGAFFMHTIRYVIGDEIFFPALKKFVTSPDYTYDNLVNTDDVEKHFSNASGKDLKPLFDLFLRTTDKLVVSVKQTAEKKYLVKILNPGISVPLDIQTDKGVDRILLDSKGIAVESVTTPVIDPAVFYFKKVILE